MFSFSAQSSGAGWVNAYMIKTWCNKQKFNSGIQSSMMMFFGKGCFATLAKLKYQCSGVPLHQNLLYQFMLVVSGLFEMHNPNVRWKTINAACRLIFFH